MSLHFHSISNLFENLKCHHHGQFQFVNEKNALMARSTSKCDPEWEFKLGVSFFFHTISVCFFFFSMKFTHSVLFSRVWICRSFVFFSLSNGTHEWTMAPLEYFHLRRTLFELYAETDIQSVWQVVAFVAYYLCRLRPMLLRMFLFFLFFLNI